MLHPKTGNGIQPKCGKKDATLPNFLTHSRHSCQSTSWRPKNPEPPKQCQNKEESWWQLVSLCPSASMSSGQLRRSLFDCLGFIGGWNTPDSQSGIRGGGLNWCLECQFQTQTFRQDSPFLSFVFIFIHIFIYPQAGMSTKLLGPNSFCYLEAKARRSAESVMRLYPFDCVLGLHDCMTSPNDFSDRRKRFLAV